MKRYGVVKVRNPSTDGHIVRLLPLQAFEVVCTKFSATDKFDVVVSGGFLVKTEVVETDSSITFKIEQKYDVSNWVEISDLFAGNVTLIRKCEKIDDRVRLCIYCSGIKSKDTVVTVVNPDHALVKLEPHQVLQIVTYNKEVESKWSISNTDLLMKCVKCETVINDPSNVYDKDSIFCAEPRSSTLKRNDALHLSGDFLPNEVLGIRSIVETHFWFCLPQSEVQRFYAGSDTVHSGGVIQIKEEVDDAQSLSKMELLIAVRSKNKMGIDYFGSINANARSWRDRSLSYSRKCLLCPNLIENLNVSDSESSFYVEIPNPLAYFDDFSELPDGICWQPQGFGVHCFELRSRYINGHLIQRFLITGIGIIGQNLDLGNVVFSTGYGKSIVVNFWKVQSGYLPVPIVKNEKTALQQVSSRMEVEFELVQDGKLDGECTPLNEVCGFDYASYSEYGYCYYPQSHDVKKKYTLGPVTNIPNILTTRMMKPEFISVSQESVSVSEIDID